MKHEALILPQGLEEFAEARAILSGRWGQVYKKTAQTDLRNIGFILTKPCLSFLISGQERLSVGDEQDLVLDAKDLVIIPSGKPFQTNFRHQDGPLQAYLFFFSRELIQEFDKSVHLPRAMDGNTLLYLKSSERMTVFMESMDQIYSGIEPDDELVKVKLLELLHFVALQAGVEQVKRVLQGSVDTSRPYSITDIMRSDFSHDLSVEDYARIADRPIASFNREFKRIFGMPPGKWLYREKMKKAAQLLSESETTVTQVGLHLGYQNTSHFIERFSQYFGETPKKFQRRLASANRAVSIR